MNLSSSIRNVLFGTFTLRFSTGLTGGLLAFYLGHLENHGGETVSTEQFAVLYAAFYATELIASPIFGVLSDRIGHHRVMQFGPIFGMVAVTLTALTTNLFLLGGTRVLEGAAAAASIPSILGFLAMATSSDEALRGRTSARFELATLGGIGAGTLAAGILYDGIPGVWAGLGALAFFLNAGIYGISFLIYRYGVREPDRPPTAEPGRSYGIARYATLLRKSHIWLLAPTWIAVNAAIGVYSGQGLFNLIRIRDPRFEDQLLAGGLSGLEVTLGPARGGCRFRGRPHLLGRPVQHDSSHDDPVLRHRWWRGSGRRRARVQPQRHDRSSVARRPLRSWPGSACSCWPARRRLHWGSWPICRRPIRTTEAQ